MTRAASRAWSYAGAIVVWAILALVLVVSPTLASASAVLAVAVTLLLIPVAFRSGSLEAIFRSRTQVIFICVFVILTGLFAVTARQPRDVLFFANFISLPLSALVYLVAFEHRGKGAALILARLCLLGALVGLASALYDVLVLNLERAQGLLGNPNTVPRIALPLGFVALIGAMLDVGSKRFVYLSAPVAAIVTTVLTGSRGAFLAVPVLLLIALVFLWRTRDGRWIALAGLGIVAAGISAGLLLEGPEVFGRLASIVETAANVFATGNAAADFATQERLNMYGAGFSAFQLSPWIGWGWAYLGNAAAQVAPSFFAHEAGTGFMFHNDLVNFAVAGGVIGVACLVAILVAPIVGALATAHDDLFAERLYGCVTLSASFAIFGLTDSTLGFDAPTVLFAYLSAMVMGTVRSS